MVGLSNANKCVRVLASVAYGTGNSNCTKVRLFRALLAFTGLTRSVDALWFASALPFSVSSEYQQLSVFLLRKRMCTQLAPFYCYIFDSGHGILAFMQNMRY